MIDFHLTVIGKNPTPGECKSRLAESLGEELAAHLMKDMLVLTLSRFDDLISGQKILLGPKNLRELSSKLDIVAKGWQLDNSAPADLESVLKTIFTTNRQSHWGFFVSDAPFFSSEDVLSSTLWLQKKSKRAVVFPSTDGGYNGVFVNAALSDTKSGEMLLGTENALEKLISILEEDGFSILVTEAYPDIDTLGSIKEILGYINCPQQCLKFARKLSKVLDAHAKLHLTS